MGKIVCGMKGGYESPAFGAWGLGIICQSVVALLFFMLLSGDALPEKGAEANQLQFADRTTLTYLAATHALSAAAVSVLTFLGYLFSSCFLCPLGLLSIGVQAALLTTCGICGSLLTASVNFADSVLSAARAMQAAPVPNLSEIFVLYHEGKLLLICILCLVAIVPFSRGVSFDAGAPAYEVLLYTSSLALMLASASAFLFIRAVPGLAGLSTAWICAALCIGVAMIIQKCCCSRVLAIGLSAAFFICAVFGIVSMSAICALFAQGKGIYLRLALSKPSASSAAAIAALTDKQFDSYRAFALANNGTYLVLAACFNAAAIYYTTFSGFNCLRTICACRRRNDTEDDDKDSDRA